MAQKCLSFDGADDLVDCGTDVSLSPTTITIEAWIKLAVGGGSEQTIIGRWGGSFANSSYLVRVLNSRLCFYTCNGSSSTNLLGGTELQTDTWYYVVAIHNASEGKSYLYLNGSSDATPALKNTPQSITTYATKIGVRGNNLYDFKGLIDEIRVSNVVRTQAEMDAIWNNGNGVQFEVDANTVALWHMNEGSASTIYDETNNDNDGTITGASWTDGYSFLISRPTSSDAGSGIDAATLSKVFFSTDSGVGLGALAALLAVINTSEVSSGSDRLRAKIESATTGGDMKLPPDGQASFPSRKVGI